MFLVVLPEKAEKIIDTLNRSGYEAYAVGGCVRDLISGKEPDDYDITTNALPDEIKKVFHDCKTIDTGIKHGTVTVIADGFYTEVTTYRIDGEYKDSRRPENVTFSKNLKDDLSRRDFTINAIAYNKTDGLKDCFGGVSDIKEKIIRCVGSPEKRFNEDALRILRAVRFASVLGYTVEKNTSEAIHNYAHLLENISKERIYVEIKKLICGENAENVLKEYRDVIKIIFPGLAYISDEDYNTAAKMAATAEGDAVFRLAALMYFLPPDGASDMMRSLKCDKAAAMRVGNSLSALPVVPDSEINALKCLYFTGDGVIFDYLALKILYFKSIGDTGNAEIFSEQLETVKKAVLSKKPYKISQLGIKGSDLAENNIAKGSDIGKTLEALLFAVIEGKVPNTRDGLLKYVEKNER